MKKTIFLLATMMFAISAFAVTPEELKESADRIEKLNSIEKPDDFGLSQIRAYSDKALELKDKTIEIADKLTMFYNPETGDMSDGEAVTLDEAKEVSKMIEEQGKLLADAAVMATKATADIKNAKGTDKLKAPKSVKSITETITLVTKETAYQTKVIAEILAAIAQ